MHDIPQLISQWETTSNVDTASMNELCRKADIVKKLYTQYDASWKPLPDKIPLAAEHGLPLARLVANAAAASSDRVIRLKYLNSLLNLRDIFKCNDAALNSSIDTLLGEAC